MHGVPSGVIAAAALHQIASNLGATPGRAGRWKMSLEPMPNPAAGDGELEDTGYGRLLPDNYA